MQSASHEKRQDSHRMLGLELQALARAFLSGRGAAEAVVRVLRRSIRHGRDQQYFLSTARRSDLQGLARAGAGRFHLRGQSESILDPSEEAERRESAAQEISGSRQTLAGTSGPYPLSTAAALAFGPGSIGVFPGLAARRPVARLRISRSELDGRRSLSTVGGARCLLLRSRHARAGCPAPGRRAARIRPLSRGEGEVSWRLSGTDATELEQVDGTTGQGGKGSVRLFQQRRRSPCPSRRLAVEAKASVCWLNQLVLKRIEK